MSKLTRRYLLLTAVTILLVTRLSSLSTEQLIEILKSQIGCPTIYTTMSGSVDPRLASATVCGFAYEEGVRTPGVNSHSEPETLQSVRTDG